MKQTILNEGSEVYHLYYLQSHLNNGISCIELKNQEVGQYWQSIHIRSKQLLEIDYNQKRTLYVSQNSINTFVAPFVSNLQIKWSI